MKEIITKLVTKHWDSNWHDSRTIEDEVNWIMIFAQDIVAAWLRKFGKEIEEEEKS